MTTLKLTHEGEILKSFNVPDSWNDVSMAQFYELRENPEADNIKIIAILTGLEYEEIYNSSMLDLRELVNPHLKFVTSIPELLKTPPQSIIFEGVKIEIPQDIRLESLGQKFSLERQCEGKYDIECYPDALCYYLYTKITGKTFNQVEADKMKERIMSGVDCITGMTIATFFLRRWLKSYGQNPTSNHRPGLMTKLKQVFISSTNSESTQPLTPSQGGTS